MPNSVSIDLLPHRDAALFLDSAEMVNDVELIARQVVPVTHPVLRGHFPHFPIWPGALLIEALAQTAALLYLKQRNRPLDPGEIPVLGAVEARFLEPVYPGEQLMYRTKLIRRINGNALFTAVAECNRRTVARAKIGVSTKQLSLLAAR